MPDLTCSQTVALTVLKDAVGPESWKLCCGLVMELAGLDLETGKMQVAPNFDPNHAEIQRLEGELAEARKINEARYARREVTA